MTLDILYSHAFKVGATAEKSVQEVFFLQFSIFFPDRFPAKGSKVKISILNLKKKQQLKLYTDQA